MLKTLKPRVVLVLLILLAVGGRILIRPPSVSAQTNPCDQEVTARVEDCEDEAQVGETDDGQSNNTDDGQVGNQDNGQQGNQDQNDSDDKNDGDQGQNGFQGDQPGQNDN